MEGKSALEACRGGPAASGNPPAVSRIGLWLRRYRRLLPFPLVAIAFIGLHPQASGSEFTDTLISAVGITLCTSGQLLRAWAWGSNAEVGKWGLRDRGPYALMRHPLYSGNFLILLGAVVIFNNLWAYLLWLLPFAYLYHVSAQVEETRMTREFGREYHEYRARSLPRFLPAISQVSKAVCTTLPFNRGCAWRKEYRSCCAWLAGIAGLELYKRVLGDDGSPYWGDTWFWVACLGVSVTLGVGLTVRKKLANSHRRRLRDAHGSQPAARCEGEETAGET